MREKARLFRSLMLESLECRAVLSADGLDVWQFSRQSSHPEFDHIQLAEPQLAEHTFANGALDRANGVHRDIQFGQHLRRSSPHRLILIDDFDMLLPPAEGEGRPHDDARPPFNSNQPNRIPSQPSEPHIVLFIGSSPAHTVFSQPRDLNRNSVPHAPVNPSTPHSLSNLPTNSASGNVSLDRAPGTNSQNATVATPILLTSNSLAQANLVALSLSTVSAGATTFDFSSQLGSNNEQSTVRDFRGPRTGEFNFAKPQSTVSDSLFDPELVERTESLASLECLLSDLAEDHRGGLVQNGFDANQPTTRSEQNWRAEQVNATIDVGFATAGMIALALNRDAALSEFEDISEEALGENGAWIANVGVFRAFESGAVPVTEFAGLTNRLSRNTETRSTKVDWSEIESEVAYTQLRPLLASTSAALGIMILGLRRIRKSVPLMYTSRNR